jgi:ketosteroid isomerase-like protein
MSAENAEIVQRLFDQLSADDLESWREIISEDVVWDASNPAAPGAGVYEGHQGVVRFFTDWVGTWESPKLELLEVIDAGGPVVAVFRWTGRGKGSGIEVNATFYGLYELEDGRIVHFRLYETRQDAIEAARTG